MYILKKKVEKKGCIFLTYMFILIVCIYIHVNVILSQVPVLRKKNSRPQHSFQFQQQWKILVGFFPPLHFSLPLHSSSPTNLEQHHFSTLQHYPKKPHFENFKIPSQSHHSYQHSTYQPTSLINISLMFPTSLCLPLSLFFFHISLSLDCTFIHCTCYTVKAHNSVNVYNCR